MQTLPFQFKEKFFSIRQSQEKKNLSDQRGVKSESAGRYFIKLILIQDLLISLRIRRCNKMGCVFQFYFWTQNDGAEIRLLQVYDDSSNLYQLISATMTDAFLQGMIKVEEDSLFSPQADHNFFNHCLTSFYDHDSSVEIIHTKCSVQEVMDFLEGSIDICDTPLNEIIKFVLIHPEFKAVDIDLVRSKIIRQKSILKRLRAKNRKAFIKPKFDEASLALANNVSTDLEEEAKRKRNRISAQTSRDRKKQQVRELEQLKQKLERQFEEMKLENQMLKKQVQRKKSEEKFSIFGQSLKNKFTKLLILLGIIFLLGVLKDVFTPEKSSANYEILKITAMEEEKKVEPSLDYSRRDSAEHQKIIEIIEEPLQCLVEQPEAMRKIKKGIQGKMDVFFAEDQGNYLPCKIKEGLRKAALFVMN